MLNKIRTKDRLNRMGIRVDDQCVLCAHALEDRDHLFCSCAFVQEARADILHHFQLKTNASCWDEWWHWLLKISRGRTSMAKQKRCIGAAFAYEVWRVRNDKIFSSLDCTPAMVAGRVIHNLVSQPPGAMLFCVRSWRSGAGSFMRSCVGEWEILDLGCTKMALTLFCEVLCSYVVGCHLVLGLGLLLVIV
ncbi:hypothetical protein Dimus_039413 [Dionaea muscipula]